MYIRRNIRFNIIAKFAWKNLLIFTAWTTFIVWGYHHFDHHKVDISIPFLPLSTIGIAVAFYIGFKNNASYDRFWEGRKIWGGIVNYSRTWGNQVMSFVSNRHAATKFSKDELNQIHQTLIYRHIAWLNALRLHLRQPSLFSPKHNKAVKKMLTEGTVERKHWNEEVGIFMDNAEYCHLIKHKNTPTQIIRKQGEELRVLMEESGLIEDFRHMEMMRVLEEFYNLQGKAERIKNTPFPRQYAFFSKIFTWVFILLLPFGMVREFDSMGHNFMWLTVPFCVLISWIFITMEIVGDNSEDPFEGFVNDVPMSALCRTIEIDLREMLGETDLPPSVKPEHDILL
jgi:ion channel-forming bestrophin family protein